MKFDKSKAYTALNADELKVGSRVIVADTPQDLVMLFTAVKRQPWSRPSIQLKRMSSTYLLGIHGLLIVSLYIGRK